MTIKEEASSIPVRGQIIPARIFFRDQRILLLPSPAFELFLPRDGVADVAIMLAINQVAALIALRETLRAFVIFVLPHPSE